MTKIDLIEDSYTKIEFSIYLWKGTPNSML